MQTTFAPETGTGTTSKIDNPFEQGSRIAVVGAGAFGGWTALNLLRKGFKVTLIDTWGPGNSYSSSGGESRLIRAVYGDNWTYFDFTMEALELWKEFEELTETKLFHHTGALWLIEEDNEPFIEKSLPFFDSAELPYERLAVSQLLKKFRNVNTRMLAYALWEPEAGYLMAREATMAVVDQFLKEGGEYLQNSASPGNGSGDHMENLNLGDGTVLNTDYTIFACGPWLRDLFPELLGEVLKVTRQEVYYFGVPEKETGYWEDFPAWINWNPQDVYYGLYDRDNRGFKVAWDHRGPVVDPSTMDRTPDPDEVQSARKFLQLRFPSLSDAPLLESRVCQYTNTPDGNFFLTNHPERKNVWMTGGGSGHGFKHGPVWGRYAAEVLCGERELDGMFRL